MGKRLKKFFGVSIRKHPCGVSWKGLGCQIFAAWAVEKFFKCGGGGPPAPPHLHTYDLCLKSWGFEFTLNLQQQQCLHRPPFQPQSLLRILWQLYGNCRHIILWSSEGTNPGFGLEGFESFRLFQEGFASSSPKNFGLESGFRFESPPPKKNSFLKKVPKNFLF